jgi:hypothetical protein
MSLLRWANQWWSWRPACGRREVEEIDWRRRPRAQRLHRVLVPAPLCIQPCGPGGIAVTVRAGRIAAGMMPGVTGKGVAATGEAADSGRARSLAALIDGPRSYTRESPGRDRGRRSGHAVDAAARWRRRPACSGASCPHTRAAAGSRSWPPSRAPSACAWRCTSSKRHRPAVAQLRSDLRGPGLCRRPDAVLAVAARHGMTNLVVLGTWPAARALRVSDLDPLCSAGSLDLGRVIEKMEDCCTCPSTLSL